MKHMFCGGVKMQSWKPESGSIEMWIIATAIGKQHDLIDQMQKNEDGSYPIHLSVGGIKLDLSLVVKRIEEEIDRLTKDRAQRLLEEKLFDVCSELEDMQERIRDLKKRYFRYDWE